MIMNYLKLSSMFPFRERTSITSSRGATHWSGEIWHMMMPVLRQGWVVKQNMTWWWYFVAMLYRNIIKPSKHLQGGILTVTYCTFWIDIINKYYTFAQIGLKIKVFMIVMKWPKSSIEYCMECVDLCIQLSIRQSVTGQGRVWSACPSMTSSNYHHPLVRWMMTQ